MDLSYPCDGSVNDGLELALCSLSYVSVDTMASEVQALGKGTLMAKVDIEEAYHLSPVHSNNRPLLGSDGNTGSFAMRSYLLPSWDAIFLQRAGVVPSSVRSQAGLLLPRWLYNDWSPSLRLAPDKPKIVDEICSTLCIPLEVQKWLVCWANLVLSRHFT